MATLLDRFRSIIVKASEALVSSLSQVEHGASASGHPAYPTFSAVNSMSAMARFPYVYAVATRRAADMSGLPIRLYAGNPDTDPDAIEITDHPLLDLLEQPSSDATGEEIRRQLSVDFSLTGDWFLLKVSPVPMRPPVSLFRLHPGDVRIVPAGSGPRVESFEVVNDDGKPTRYAPDLIIHARSPSWERGPAGLYGQGMIAALSDDLTTKLQSREHQLRLSGQGRPDVVLSPAEEGETWTEDDRKAILDAYKKMANKGGPLILGGAAKASFLNLTPREMEFLGLDDRIRRSIMAAGMVPPVILGEESANYATARQQDALYWRGIAHDVRLFDARLTLNLARSYGRVNGRKLYVRHDLSGVIPLQLERTDQITRAHLHMVAGATPAEAYAYEGLAGAPVSSEFIQVAPASPAEPRAIEAIPQPPPTRAFPHPLPDPAPTRGHLGDPGEDDLAHTTAESKAPNERTRWEGWLVKVHKPGERRIGSATRKYLKAAAQRYAERLAEASKEAGLKAVSGDPGLVILTRTIDTNLVVSELDEVAQMRLTIGDSWVRTWSLAAVAALDDVPIDLSDIEFDPAHPAVVRSLDRFLKNATRTQSEAVRFIVEAGLEEGASIGTMQERIVRSAAFSPARARRIARTESTRSVNLGTVLAYREAQDKGVEVEKSWLTAGFGVRESHQIDGQTRSLSGLFESKDGNFADHPGAFNIAAEDINCRCTTVPKVKALPPLF